MLVRTRRGFQLLSAGMQIGTAIADIITTIYTILGHILKGLYVYWRRTCTPIVIATWLTIAKDCNQSRCSSTYQWALEVWYMHNGMLWTYKEKQNYKIQRKGMYLETGKKSIRSLDWLMREDMQYLSFGVSNVCIYACMGGKNAGTDYENRSRG